MCDRGAERRLRRLQEEEVGLITAVYFEAYGRTLEKVMAFNYLGIILTALGDEWPALVKNLRKVQTCWA